MLSAMSDFNPPTRAFIIPTATELDDGRLIVRSDEAEAWFERMCGVLLTVGGTLSVQTEREKVGEMGGEPIAVTTYLVARWSGKAPMIDPEAGEPAPPATPPEA